MNETNALIINSVSTIGGVVVGALLTNYLNTTGKVKIFITDLNFNYSNTKFENGIITEETATFDKANQLVISFTFDSFNSSKSNISIRELRLLNDKGNRKKINNLSTKRTSSGRWLIDTLEVINILPCQTIQNSVQITLDKDFYGSDKISRLYLEYRINNNWRRKKIELKNYF